MDKIKVGQFLKLLREQKGKKQYQVAIELSKYGIEVSDKTVAKWEKGNFPDMDKLAVIAEYYGVKVSDILNGEVYTPQNFEEKYFIVNNEWMHRCPQDELYQTRVAQERIVKARVKELFTELIKIKSLTAMKNEELNFLLANFYSASNYAMKMYGELASSNKNELKVLRREIYREILSMHDSSADEIYWEIKKLFDYNRRATFRKDVRGYEANIQATEDLLLSLDDWEKDLLLAQVQTQNIADFYDKLTYFRHYGIDYDEERITKEGIKLLIRCGAKLNPSLLGYRQYRYNQFSVLDRMETLHSIVDAKLLISKYNEATHTVGFYWAENNTKNRLIDLYYMMDCRLKKDEKLTLNELYKLFMNNDTIPENILLERNKDYAKPNMSRKEQLLQAEWTCVGEIDSWRKCKEQEMKIEGYKKELYDLEKQWNSGEQIGQIEYEEWVGEEDGVLTENDILLRLSKLSYSQFIAGRNTELTEELVACIDTLTLDEIRQRYFPVETRYEEL